MSRDMILKDEDDGTLYSYSNIRTQSYFVGHIAGLEAAASWLMDKAVQMFREGDTKADWLRHMVKMMKDELEPRMRKQIKDHERDFPELVESDQ